MRTIPLYLLALIVAIANTPLDIYQICAWNVGTAKTEPWRSKRPGAIARTAGAVLSRVRAWLGPVDWVPALTAVGLVAVLLTAHADAHTVLLAGIVSGAASLRALREKSVEIHTKLTTLNDKAVAAATAGGPALTDEERASVKTLKAEFDTIEDLRLEAERLNKADMTFGVVPVDPDAKVAAKAAGIVMGKDRSEDDPKRGYKDHKELLADVMEAGRTGRVSAKLKPLQATQGSDEAGVYSDPHGGFLVPSAVAPGLLQTDAEADFIAPLVTSISPMTAPTVSFNARVDKDHTTSVSGGFVVTRRPETVDGTSSRAVFDQVVLTANEEFGLAFATERIINDSPQSFVAIVNAGFTDEFANNGIKERLRGSGVGERLGIFHALNTCLVSQAKETSQAVDTIVKENIDKMASRCWRYTQAIWIANPDTRPQLRSLVQNIGIGGTAVSYFESDGGVEKLDGRPIYFTEHASKLGDVDDLALCVWSQYLEGEYQQLQTAESIHVRFAAAERCFRFYKRNDGRPWWRAPLTPAQSAQTLSPFVVLAAR